MLIEGLTLYYKVVKVFNTDFKMWPFCAFSWGKFNLTNDDKKTSKSTWPEINEVLTQLYTSQVAMVAVGKTDCNDNCHSWIE